MTVAVALAAWVVSCVVATVLLRQVRNAHRQPPYEDKET